jgi:hypothetical protein
MQIACKENVNNANIMIIVLDIDGAKNETKKKKKKIL